MGSTFSVSAEMSRFCLCEDLSIQANSQNAMFKFDRITILSSKSLDISRGQLDRIGFGSQMFNVYVVSLGLFFLVVQS